MPTAQMPNSPIPSKRMSFSPKIIFVILAVVVLVEVIFAVKTLSQPTPAQRVAKAKAVTKSQISIVSVKKEYKVGDLVPVSILVETGSHKTIGTDVILHYDSNLLEATSSSVIKKGTIYQDFPALGLDPKTSIVTVSGINTADRVFQGLGLLATINFIARAPGLASVTVDFTPNSTTDTNVVDSISGKDILEQVENLNLTIRQ